MTYEDTFHLGIKGLIRGDSGKILLLRVNKQMLDGVQGAYWDFPGGRVHYGEAPEAALRREVEEETGIADLTDVEPFTMLLSPIRIPQQNSRDVGLILWIFTCNAPLREELVLSEEHTETGWFTPAEAADRLRIKYPVECTEKLRRLV